MEREEIYLKYTDLLQRLAAIRREIEELDAGEESPSKLYNLVTYAAEEAAIRLQEAARIAPDSPSRRAA